MSPQLMPSTHSSETRARVFDVLVALASACLNSSIVVSITEGSLSGPRSLGLGLAVAHSLTLAVRRTAPWVSFGLNLAMGLATVAIGFPMVFLGLAPLISLYSIATQTEQRRSATALVLSLIVLGLSAPLTDQSEDLGTMVGNALGLGGAWLIGTFVHARQFYVRQLEQRTLELESARHELAEQAVTQERLRIARELHDLVAHSLSIITLRSGVAAHVMDDRPDEVRRSLETIEDVSRGALDEMRRMLTMLRNGSSERLPLPGLADIERLADGVRDGGLSVQVSVPDMNPPLPAALDLTAYRIVQESLTNVMKHASADVVRVVIQRSARALLIEVIDDGAPPERLNGSGHGITGMMERAHLFGGTLETGPLPEGGYRVRASLPLGPVVAS